jgi:hypothetical protein
MTIKLEQYILIILTIFCYLAIDELDFPPSQMLAQNEVVSR